MTISKRELLRLEKSLTPHQSCLSPQLRVCASLSLVTSTRCFDVLDADSESLDCNWMLGFLGAIDVIQGLFLLFCATVHLHPCLLPLVIPNRHYCLKTRVIMFVIMIEQTAAPYSATLSKFSYQSESSSESNSGMLGSVHNVSGVQTSKRKDVRAPQKLISKAAIHLRSKRFLYQLLLFRCQW